MTYRMEQTTAGVKPHTFSGVMKIEGANRRFDVMHNDGQLFATGSIILSSSASHLSTVLDPAAKTYYVLDFDQIAARAAKAQKDLGAYLTIPKPQVSVKDEGPGAQIEGFPTERWLITVSLDVSIRGLQGASSTRSVITTELWTTSRWPADAATFSDYTQSPGGDSLLDAMDDARMKITGFPLGSVATTTIVLGGGTTTSKSRMTVTGIHDAAFPPSDFVIPAGYRKVDSPIDAMFTKAGIR